jgi:hypothetical protein
MQPALRSRPTRKLVSIGTGLRHSRNFAALRLAHERENADRHFRKFVRLHDPYNPALSNALLSQRIARLQALDRITLGERERSCVDEWLAEASRRRILPGTADREPRLHPLGAFGQ